MKINTKLSYQVGLQQQTTQALFFTELDSLSSEGDSTSFAEEENSGTESMLATTVTAAPPNRNKPKSKSPPTVVAHNQVHTAEKHHGKVSKSSTKPGVLTCRLFVQWRMILSVIYLPSVASIYPLLVACISMSEPVDMLE